MSVNNRSPAYDFRDVMRQATIEIIRMAESNIVDLSRIADRYKESGNFELWDMCDAIIHYERYELKRQREDLKRWQ